MHISEELNRLRTKIKQQTPAPEEKFVSVMEPHKEVKPAPKSRDELNRFELLLFRKNHLPVFKASGTREMSFNTEKTEWVKSEVDSLNELLRRFLKFNTDCFRAIIYDNQIESDMRDERWIFKVDNGKITFNQLHQYPGVRKKHLIEINSIPTI